MKLTRHRLIGLLATTACLVVTTAGAVPAATIQDTPANAAARQSPWMNTHLSPRQRARILRAHMTLPEKVGQMDQIVGERLRGDCKFQNGPLRQDCMKRVLVTYHTGSILSGGSDNPVHNTGRGWAEQYDAIQRYAISHTRLHIPIVYGVDAVHGFGHPVKATLFPQQIGMGATWDPGLAKQAAAVTRKGLRATGNFWDFAPVLGISRDNRWGRYYETYGEAPYLVAALGAAQVRGLQGDDPKHPIVAATDKHFAGYSQSINGHDRVEAQLPLRYLREHIFPGYRAGVEAGAATAMANSGSVNGVPVTGSHYLLTDVLRYQMGFDGVVVSDWADVPALQTAYHVAGDLEHAVARAVNAGVDMAMEPYDAKGFTSALLAAVHDHLVSRHRIDQAVLRILTLKFRLGLFDHPYVDPSKANAAVTAGRDLARKAADESVTLLRNEDGTLPLSPDARKLVVAGPSADSMARQLGGWSVSWQGVPDGVHPPGTTVLDGVRKAVSSSTDVAYAPDKDEAVAQAQDADAVIVAVGEKPYAEGAGDDPTPRLSAGQRDLVQALENTGTPVVVVVVAGRPLGLGPAAKADGLLMAYLPGTEGGAGVADVLFGKVNPSGKLPVTWPAVLGNQPMVHDLLPGTSSAPHSKYDPLYPMGYGLSYTSYDVSGLSARARNGTVTATFTVTNTGDRAGTDVVPVYVHRPVSRVLVPPKRLVGFTRVTLDPGQAKAVRASFPASRLAVVPGDVDAQGPLRVRPGSYQAMVDDLTAGFTITR
ncbi:MAG: beta-glucosidase family protein [Streptosporangiaceae bacterium]